MSIISQSVGKKGRRRSGPPRLLLEEKLLVFLIVMSAVGFSFNYVDTTPFYTYFVESFIVSGF